MRVASEQVLDTANPGVAQGTGQPSLPQLGEQDRDEPPLLRKGSTHELEHSCSTGSFCPCTQMEMVESAFPLGAVGEGV